MNFPDAKPPFFASHFIKKSYPGSCIEIDVLQRWPGSPGLFKEQNLLENKIFD
jgi:hypothetical protein